MMRVRRRPFSESSVCIAALSSKRPADEGRGFTGKLPRSTGFRDLDLDQVSGERIENGHAPLPPNQAPGTNSNAFANDTIIGAPTPFRQVDLFTRTLGRRVNSANRSRPQAVVAPHRPAALRLVVRSMAMPIRWEEAFRRAFSDGHVTQDAGRRSLVSLLPVADPSGDGEDESLHEP